MSDHKKLALQIARLARGKKALKVMVLDMRKVCNFCEYFVIASGSSLRQVNAIAEHIDQEMKKEGERSLSTVPANDASGWIVLDYSSIVVHIFHAPLREFYDLEHLWSDAARVRVPAGTSGSSK
ncbi:MAG TPA: ribosome silencing factor [Candidatus Omnitrophota bacterium]|nr:ribosome silencing factor [Candidatus Omnitrophota bacterium]HQJ15773.1 ribosome silencing factor [Candidatus Omnitrophota bacterium]